MITAKGPIRWAKVATPLLRDSYREQRIQKGCLSPYHPCMAYLPTFGLNFWLKFMVNVGKFTKLISKARIVTFRIVTFFQKNPNGSKVRKSDIFSIFEQNMCRVLVVWGCRVLVVFFLSISGNGWLMNLTACIYAQKMKDFYIMKTYLCNVSSCLQFSLQVSTTIVQLFSHVWSWWCVCEWERLREDLREAQDASNYNNSNNHNKQQQ